MSLRSGYGHVKRVLVQKRFKCGSGDGQAGLERVQCFEGRFVGFRRFIEASDFSDELQRSSASFPGSDRRFKIVKRFDISAHRR